MDEYLVGIAALALFLFVVALIGHGIWVFFAWLVSLVSGKPSAPESRPTCPACFARLVDGTRCPVCAWDARMPGAPIKVFAALELQLSRYVRSGWIDRQEYDRLRTAILIPARPDVGAPDEAILVEVIEETPPVPLRPAERLGATSGSGLEAFLAEASAPSGAPAAHSPAPPAERARQFSERRTAAAAEPRAPATPTQQKQPALSQLISAFMEEKNIRWGELVGGLLIVCCSIALVISFWSQIAQRPYLKFFVFNGVTAGLFGLGFYAHHRWRLATTSQGLLVVAALLVPLNFLAFTAFTDAAPPSDVLTIAGELASIALFSALTYAAGQILVPGWSLPMAVAVMVASVSQLVVRRFVGPATPQLWLMADGALPVATCVASSLWILQSARRHKHIDESLAHRVLKFLGIASFAVVLPLGLLVFKSHNIAHSLQAIAPLMSLSGFPVIAAGLLLWRRVTDSSLTALRMTGTTLAIFGVLLMGAATALAWPQPAAMLTVGVVNAVLLTAMAVAFDFAVAHILAVACLIVVYVLAYYLGTGQIEWNAASGPAVARLLVSAATARVLVPMVALLAVAAGLWRSVGRKTDALVYLGASGVTAALSIALITWFGFAIPGDPHGATWIYLAYAAVAFAIAVRTGHAAATWSGSLLLLVGLVQALSYRYAGRLGLEYPWVSAMIAHAGVLCIAVAVLGFSGYRASKPLYAPLLRSAVITSLLASILLGWIWPDVSFAFAAGYLYLLAVVWAALAMFFGSPALFIASQLVLAAAAIAHVSAWLVVQPWYGASRWPWLDPWSLQAYGIALAGLSLAWAIVRLVLPKPQASDPETLFFEMAGSAGDDVPPLDLKWWRRSVSILFHGPLMQIDRVAGPLAACVLIGLALYAVVPGVALELWPDPNISEGRPEPPLRQFELFGAPHLHAASAGSWILLAAVATLFAFHWVRTRKKVAAAALLLMLLAACPLWAAQWESQLATASALRWSLVGFAAIACCPLLVSGLRRRLADSGEPGAVSRELAVAAVLLSLPAVIALTLNALVLWAGGGAPSGPAPGSFFAGIGIPASYAGPLFAFAALLVLMAVGLREAAAALVAGVVFMLGVSAAYLGSLPRGIPPNTVDWLHFFQANALAAGWFSLAWLATGTYASQRATDSSHRRMAQFAQLLLGLICMAAFMLPGFVHLLFGVLDERVLYEAANRLGFIAIAACMSALAWLAFVHKRPSLAAVAGSSMVVVVTLVAFGLATWGDVWPTFHAILVGYPASAWVLLLGGTYVVHRVGRRPGMEAASARWELISEPPRPVVLGSIAVTWLAVVLALWALARRDPQAPWWSLGALVSSSLLSAAAAWLAIERRFIYGAAVTLAIATTVYWAYGSPTSSRFAADMAELGWVNLLMLALPMVNSVVFERWRWSVRAAPYRGRLVPFHRVASYLALGLSLMLVALSLATDISERSWHPNAVVGWLGLLGVAVAFTACLWDPTDRDSVARLYVLGLVAVGMGLHELRLPPHLMGFVATMLLAAYSVATSYLWTRREKLIAVASRLGVPRGADDSLAGLAWLVPANLWLTIAVIALTFWVELTFAEYSLRLLAAQAAVAQAIAVGMLAHGRRRSTLQATSLAVGVLAAVAFGWAWLTPGTTGTIMNRAVVVTAAVAGMTVLYGLGFSKLVRRENDWTRAARDLSPALACLAAASIVFVLGAEVVYTARQAAVPMAPAAIAAIAVSLLGLCAAALAAALLPGRDPLSLPERGRTVYVYAAEICLALLFMHIRLTMPWLFSGYFRQYWPLIAMGIAFLGVGLSELFRRQRIEVLSEPLERTGALLPLLPVIGYWIVPARVNYSLLLIAAGALYTALSVIRRSFGFGVLAALAANGGLWFFLKDLEGYRLMDHPQLWLIPPALCVLVAAYLNRRQLTESQMTTVRYMTSIVIYASSTADIFLTGVAEAPWLPLVLGAFAILGIFAGIMLRVRAFLFLGTSFLVLALVTIIWYAAVDLDQTWVWSVSGIVTGILIIAIFAIFEKRRDDVLRVVEELKHWQP